MTRQKLGGVHLTYSYMRQLPFIDQRVLRRAASWDCSKLSVSWLSERVLELTYTAWDLEPFARDCGYDGPPFIWDEERRFDLRCELDAAYFQLYLGAHEQWNETASTGLLEAFPTPRHAVIHMMDAFPIVRRKDERAHGTYRTKKRILEIYDEIARAIRADHPYQRCLDPPPGPPSDATGNFIPVSSWDVDAWPAHIHRPREFMSAGLTS